MGLFSRKGPEGPRPVNEQAIAAFDQALGQLGPVNHAVDPARTVAFAAGGPPVWSVAFVSVPGYTLVVTYGLSYELSPEPERAGIGYELSIAVPDGQPTSPWADAFLRGQAHHIVTQHVELKVGECISFRGVPITRMAFAPEYAAQMPDTSLVGILVAKDPLVPVVHTPTGNVEVRRLVGIDQYEIDRAVTWNPASLLELVRGIDPQLLSPLGRASHMTRLREATEQRAQQEGSIVEGVLLDFGWQQGNGAVRIALPQGPAAARALDAIRGRVGFGRKLVAYSAFAPPITFASGTPAMELSPSGLELFGDLTTPPIALVVEALHAGAPFVDLALQAPPPTRVRAQFFARVANVVNQYDLDQLKMAKELNKLLPEAQSIAAIQVSPAEHDTDLAALNAAIRVLRFARVTDQSAVNAMIAAISPK
jgi:hypothetical protein